MGTRPSKCIVGLPHDGRIPMGEMPYSLVYGIESVIPIEIVMPSFRTMNFSKETNKTELRLNLDLLTERRERAEVC